ncbi:hypothetical protein [Ancylomarina sp. 16SWW S1-10-2]|uniref:hypothetical protein n=1 Tax=Ancylomarina sp. 16SWW S1-10-2 TaxID=2499681 RepID=UPI0012AEAABA|nr:hypothetical protein [Ancylomarina sp. 16SWW S1-10-2]MRT93518.1 hypothetical protein [Ancylomarina sp. 16SWW S1-10-2]
MNFKKTNGNNNLTQLVGELQKEDIRYAKLSKRFQIFYWALIPLYSILSIIDYTESNNIYDLMGSLCFVITLALFAIFFGKFHKEYKYVDYALPTLKMLKKAASRYQFFQLKKISLLIAILIMDAGLCLKTSLDFSVLDVQIYFLGIMLVAVLIGLIIWHFKRKPLRDNALRLIAEIEGE